MKAVYYRIKEIVRRISANGLPSTLTPTDVFHEAYTKLAVANGFSHVENRDHLYATFATTVKDVIVDYARQKNTIKRGKDFARKDLDVVLTYFTDQHGFDVLELSDAIELLPKRAARVVEMRFFGGFTIEETASTLSISVATANKDWQYARATLLATLSDQPKSANLQ